MKLLFNKFILSVAVFSLVLFTGCEDYNDLNLDPVDTGDANVTRYVAVGNSLTAGYQNSALYESAQKYSFPNLLARQFRVDDFTQPLISDPGIGGRLELTNLNPLQITQNQSQGTPKNQGEKPFENLGVPGAVLVDYTNPNNTGSLKERATNTNHPAFNPFYGIVMQSSELQKSAPNLHNQVALNDPSFITFWLGNNDVLGFVTSGGEGQSITPPANFDQLYQAAGQALAATGAKVLMYNIPDVTNIPFVFLLRAQLAQDGTIRFNQPTQSYQLNTPQGYTDIYIDVDGNQRVMRQYDFLLLSASGYFQQVAGGQVQPPVQPSTAIPDQYVLDGPAGGPQGSSELEQAVGAVTQYNNSIQNVAAANNDFTMVDIHALFAQVINNFQTNNGGYTANGITLQPVPGSLFTFDGVHVTNRGAAVIANTTINTMNSSLNADIDLIDLRHIPEGVPVSSN